MRVEVAVRVQHHPSRAHLLPALLERLGDLPVEVIEHSSDPPSPWAGYQVCLRNPPACTHLAIIQDDAVPVPNFAPAVRQIAASNPDTPVCLFLARLPRDASVEAARLMKNGGGRYVTLGWRSFLPVVATMWPRRVAVEALAWTDAHPQLPGQREPRSDDAMMGRWKTITRATVKACVPSIVQHPDETPSLIGRRAMWGRDTGRVAAFLAEDALAYEW